MCAEDTAILTRREIHERGAGIDDVEVFGRIRGLAKLEPINDNGVVRILPRRFCGVVGVEVGLAGISIVGTECTARLTMMRSVSVA